MSGGSGERLLAILDLFTEERLAWTSQEIMDRLGYSRPTVYRYIKLLRESGFLTSMPGGAFSIGPRVVEMDFLMRRSDPLIAESGRHLRDLAARFPGSAFLSQWYGDKLLCVASESREAAPRTSYPRGRPVPLSLGAVSRVIIAHLPKRERLRRIEANAVTYASLGLGETTDAVEATLKTIRRQGFAIARGEVTPGIVGVAAAILDGRRYPLAALCVSMKSADHAKIDVKYLFEAVSGSAANISDAIAGPQAWANDEDLQQMGTGT